MKTINLLFFSVVAAMLVTTGCGKPKPPAAPEMNGVVVDIPALNAAFENASPEIKATVTQVGFNIRYTKYEDALMSLDKLLNDPSVTEAQKKVVNQVIEEAKKLASAAPPPAQ
jgi:hypothetical protein